MQEEITLVDELQDRIHELENKVASLRIGRRVLLHLIDNLENERCEERLLLNQKNKKLQQCNCRYAKTIMCQRNQIQKLEYQIRNFTLST